MSACITGEPCVEDDVCFQGECCPCQLTCQDGEWSTPLCPPCAAPICPDSPPTDGDACTPCSVPSGTCLIDRCETENKKYEAACVDDKWEVVVHGCGMPECCDSDEQCASNVCVNTICKTEVTGSCWRDADCADDQLCSGVNVCACNEDCANRDYPGTCVPSSEDCCRDDSDCDGAGVQCLAGVCKEPAMLGCWSDRDCGGGICDGEVICPCGTACAAPDTPGLCAIEA
jgi:hypothetical protein